MDIWKRGEHSRGGETANDYTDIPLSELDLAPELNRDLINFLQMNEGQTTVVPAKVVKIMAENMMPRWVREKLAKVYEVETLKIFPDDGHLGRIQGAIVLFYKQHGGQ
jgi:hypothetical protein